MLIDSSLMVKSAFFVHSTYPFLLEPPSQSHILLEK